MNLFLSHVSSVNQAILMAGSYTWLNYRHQADTSYVYNILKNRGFDESKITQFAYDDMATVEENPFQGELFHTTDHINVYGGSSTVKFSGKEVTADGFYSFLKNFPGSSEDDVFIFYSDHGAPGQLGIPSGNGSPIYGDYWRDALLEMQSKGLFKRLFVVIEACESGSFINFLNKVPNTAIITASLGNEESQSYIYDEEVDNVLTDLFTYHFFNVVEEMPDATISEVFNITKARMAEEEKYSTPVFGGDASFLDLPISTFIPSNKAKDLKAGKKVIAKPKGHKIVRNREVSKTVLERISQNPKRPAYTQMKALISLKERQDSSEKLSRIVSKLARQIRPSDNSEIDYDDGCYLPAVRYFLECYPKVDEDDMDKLSVIAGLCKAMPLYKVKQAIRSAI